MSTCQKCGNNLEVLLSSLPGNKPTRQDTCPRCLSDLKICINCNFYDTSRKWECREDISERVSDKEKSNFCDYFSMNQKSSKNKDSQASKDNLLNAAEALFKKK
jgi:hypothetical protein